MNTLPTATENSGDEVVMVTGDVTGSVNVAVSAWPCESVTVTAKTAEAELGAIPVRNPVELRVSHDGRPFEVQL